MNYSNVLGEFQVIKEPRFFGSWKGRVISAIVLNNVHDWKNIQYLSELSPDILRKVLKEMFDLRILEKPYDDYYRLTDDVYNEYREYYNNLTIPIEEETIQRQTSPKHTNKDIIKWIYDWNKFKNIELPSENMHFFLQGRLLDDFSKDLICNAEKEVLAVNPYVDCCNLSDALKEACRKKIKVKLITRDPENPQDHVFFPEEKKEYHNSLKEDGVEIIYENKIHAKIVLVDKKVAIISSMNFQSSSSGGRTWEAGIISFDQKVVESISKSINSI